jgi:hypothetical protein
MGHLHTKTMNRLQAALVEHDLVIQYKKGATMPVDYLSRLPSTIEHQLAEITQCFYPFQPELELQKADPLIRIYKKCIISEQRDNGQHMSLRLMQTICKIWQQNSIKMQTKLCGFDWMTTNTHESLYFCLRNSARWHSARPTTTNLAGTMPP